MKIFFLENNHPVLYTLNFDQYSILNVNEVTMVHNFDSIVNMMKSSILIFLF